MAYFHPYHYLHSYVHNGRIGVLVEIGCESDFLFQNEVFKAFAHDMALQIAATGPESVDALLEQPFVKDDSQSVGRVIDDAALKFRERIAIARFIRWSTDDHAGPPDEKSPPRTPALIMSFRRVV